MVKNCEFILIKFVLADSSDVKTGTRVTECVWMFVWKDCCCNNAVKSLRDPGVQLSHAVDRLVGEDGMDKRSAPCKSQETVKRQVGDQRQARKR